jgi:hypothetical protein
MARLFARPEERSMDRDMHVLRLVTLAVAMLMPAIAAAQAPPQTKTPIAPQTEQLDPKAFAKDNVTVGQSSDTDMQKPAGRNLSEQLAKSDGVICPPAHIDPEIRQPTPPGGAMPVIPPPGSPGGDPSIQPK